MNWKPLSEEREILKINDDFFVIRPRNYNEPTPMGCPICHLVFKGLEDIISFKKYECCQECMYKWAQPYTEKWEDGWRPSLEEIEDHIKSIRQIPSYLIN